MRVKTRAGHFITLKDDKIIKQEMRVGKHETYYVLHLDDGRMVHAAEAVKHVPVSKVVKNGTVVRES